ncbi:MAG: hypothetical protein N3E45_11075 [Oscillatoriaceae bacterium SKW80]|nr:hypothetical protein [Oscillatoriaceae bacterium SKYG93]MCX8121350.1 hypothetical protein [Oscillatoriaceae bacterium SKW80]MDW8451974.1 hypothetical protein [Oscillatoriaceae cyanobacterium SKYGB_i_bin93]HIK29517.1 hypothetical protein [Oscillatoriaceae cyanobacterium M7585_C2015_266]
MSSNNKKTRQILSFLEKEILNIHTPEFQQGYRDAYTHESLKSEHPDYLAGYMQGTKDRVRYRDC